METSEESRKEQLNERKIEGHGNACNQGIQKFNPSRPDPAGRQKLTSTFIFTVLCGASKALKAFIKTFEAPQRSVKI